ncbi:L,D-transpeptidase [Patescibacteria group bacterium]|nr:L,D-transpeptidase [Patescibacteria group bacterium]
MRLNPRFIHWFKLFLLSLGIFLILAGAGLAGLAYSYRDTFYPGVQVAGVLLSGDTLPAGQAAIDRQVKQYLAHPVKVVIPDVSKPKLNSPDQYATLEIPTTAQDLGLNFDSRTAVQTAWSVGHPDRWTGWFLPTLQTFFQGKRVPLGYTVDQTAIRTFIDTQIVPKMGTPVPAKIAVSGTNVTVTPPQAGLQVDKQKLTGAVTQALDSATERDTTYVRAPVTETVSSITQETVRPLADRLQALGDLKLTLQAGSKRITPGTTQQLTWFGPVQDDQGNLSLAIQKENIDKYLSSLSGIEESKALNQVVTALAPLAASSSVPPSLSITLAMKPVPVPAAPTDHPTLGKFPGKYVEVVLATQRMYLIDGNNLVKSYTVSSGKWSTPTPTGTFAIHSKSPLAYSYLYGLYMPWWENFLNGEYGIHELPYWPNGYREGAAHLGIPVSDGCIRLGIGAAKEVYDWTDIGTPVYIH